MLSLQIARNRNILVPMKTQVTRATVAQLLGKYSRFQHTRPSSHPSGAPEAPRPRLGAGAAADAAGSCGSCWQLAGSPRWDGAGGCSDPHRPASAHGPGCSGHVQHRRTRGSVSSPRNNLQLRGSRVFTTSHRNLKVQSRTHQSACLLRNTSTRGGPDHQCYRTTT